MADTITLRITNEEFERALQLHNALSKELSVYTRVNKITILEMVKASMMLTKSIVGNINRSHPENKSIGFTYLKSLALELGIEIILPQMEIFDGELPLSSASNPKE